MRGKLRSKVSQCEGHLIDACRSQLRGHTWGDRALLKGLPLDRSYCIETLAKYYRSLSRDSETPQRRSLQLKGHWQGVKSRGQVAMGDTLNRGEAGTAASKRDRSQ
jgi:hypothetical protein